MSRLVRTAGYTVATLAIALVMLFVIGECSRHPTPFRRTYDRIDYGMTAEQVAEVLGPEWESQQWNARGSAWESKRWKTANNVEVIAVMFRDGKVDKKYFHSAYPLFGGSKDDQPWK